MNTENLKLARKRSGMTQQQVADAIGVVQSAYKNYEQGNREPKGDTIVMLADLFGVTTDYLLGRNTDELSNIDKLVKEFNMTALEEKILEGYLELSDDMRDNFMDFLQKSVQEVQQTVNNDTIPQCRLIVNNIFEFFFKNIDSAPTLCYILFGGDIMIKETMYDRIKRLREERHISQDELAKRCGYSSRSTISKIEKGERNLTGDKIQTLAGVLGVKPSYLMDGDTGAKVDALSIPGIIPLPATSKKPRLGAIACGEPILAEENIETYDEVPDELRCDFTLICSGDSMVNARINDGDIVYIRQQERVDNGEIAAVLIDNEATLKRVYLHDDKLILQPENPKYTPFVYTKEEINHIRILGKAVGFTSKL